MHLPNFCTLSSAEYSGIHGDIVALLEHGRRAAARSVNALMTATYWEIGRRIVEFSQGGEGRAAYGQALLERLSVDLTARFGRGFGVVDEDVLPDLPGSRDFRITDSEIYAHRLSGNFEPAIRNIDLDQRATRFQLSWTHYIHLMRRTRSIEERAFYEAEAFRGGWSVRQLDRQISSQFHTRAMLSKNRPAMLQKSGKAQPGDLVTAEEAIKDPYVLEFLISRTNIQKVNWRRHWSIASRTFFLSWAATLRSWATSVAPQ